MKRTLVIFVGLVTASLILLVSACAKPAATEAPAPKAAPAPAPAPKAAPAPAPAPKAAPAPAPAAVPSPAPKVQSVADFYANNTVTLICTQSAGGGVDYAGRLFASYWTEATGGAMVVKNDPGAAGIMAMNKIFAAKPDGLTWGVSVMGGPIIGPVLFGDEAVKFDPKKLTWVGLMGGDPYVVALSVKSPYKSIEELQKAKGLKFGTTGKRVSGALGQALIFDVFGFQDPRIVTGYGGAAEVGLAAGKGEVDGYVYGSASTSADMKKGLVKAPILVMDWKRSAWWPNLPTLPEVAKLTPKQEAYFYIFTALAGGRPFYMPPGVPDNKVQFVRQTFDKIMTMKPYLDQAKLQWSVWEQPESGDKTAAFINKVFDIPKEDVAAFGSLTDKYAR